MSYAQTNSLPLLQRINFRMIAFILIIGALVGALTYPFIRNYVTGGISMRSDGVLEIDLKHISLFEFDDTTGRMEDIPEKFRALDGKKVTFYAEVAPPQFARNNPKAFELVYSVAQCCVTASPKVQHFVQSQMSQNGVFRYTGGQVRVLGTLKVNVTRDPDTGKVNGIYHFICDQAESV